MIRTKLSKLILSLALIGSLGLLLVPVANAQASGLGVDTEASVGAEAGISGSAGATPTSTPTPTPTGGSTGDSTRTYDPTATTDVGETALFTGVTRSCWDEGTCTLCDILVVFINIADGILKLFAILASVFFVWGAGYMMMSSGNTKMIEKGKGIIRATIIGSIIVLFAWQLMNTVVFVLVKQDAIFEDTEKGREVKYSPLAWYNVAKWCGTASGQSGVEPSSGPGAGGDGSGSATPPPGWESGSGSATPPPGWESGSGSATPPPGWESGSGSTAPPPPGWESGSGSTAPPPPGWE